jgi:hypothetical protein
LADQSFDLQSLPSLFEILWGLVLLSGLALFLWWLEAGASTWLEVAAADRSARPIYTIALIIAGLWLAVWLGSLITAYQLDLIAFQLLLLAPLSVVWSIVQHPITLLMMISLWAFPLAAWFWRGRMHSVMEASWAFLDAAPRPSAWPRHASLRPGLALTMGLAGGAGYCLLLFAIRIMLRLVIPEAQRSTDEFVLSFFIGAVALAALVQAGVAVVVAAWVRRLAWVLGSFAAFVAGCVMTLGFLGINLLFGGTLDPTFAWNVFSQVVNEGALLALPCALAVSALSGWMRRSEVPSTQAVRV